MSKQINVKREKQTEVSKIELTSKSMVTGVGRKATDEELMEYLLKGINEVPIDIDIAFSKFSKEK